MCDTKILPVRRKLRVAQGRLLAEEGGSSLAEYTNPDLSIVRHLKSRGRHLEARDLLAAWLESDADNPRLLVEMAFVLDNLGLEEEAVGYYERSIERGLGPPWLADAYVGLGSSLRVLGRIWDSRQVLETGLKKFPAHPGMKVFHALTLYADNNAADAVRGLLDVLLEEMRHEDLVSYRQAIQYYREHLNDGRSPGVPVDTTEPGET